MSPYGRFFLMLSAFTLLIMVAFYFLMDVLPAKLYFQQTSYIIAFFFIVTSLFHLGLLNASQKSSRSFVTFFMAGTAMKLLLSIAIIIGFTLSNRESAFAFIFNFFVLYLLFTCFEVVMAYGHFGKQKAQ